jgi:large subunit ribosomal protein L25
MTEIVLNAEIREKGKARQLRRQGKVPGVYYAPGDENILIAVREHDLKPLIHTTETHIVNLKLGDGKEFRCILKDVEFDPVTDRPIHFDLYGLKAGTRIRIEVPIVLTGHAVGVEKGGIVEHLLHSVEIECMSTEIPEHIEVDITKLDIGDSIHIKDLNIPGIRFIENEMAVIVAIVPPRGAEITAGEEAPEEKPAEGAPSQISQTAQEQEGKSS